MGANENFELKKRYIFWGVACLGFLFFFHKIQDVLLPFYIGFFVSVFFGGIVSKCEKKLKIPRALTSIIITIAFFALIGYAIWVLIPFTYGRMTRTVGAFNRVKNSGTVESATILIQGFVNQYDLANSTKKVMSEASNLLIQFGNYLFSGVVRSATNIASTLFLLALSPIVVFMMLKDAPKIRKGFFNLLPKRFQQTATTISNDMYESVFSYLEGQVIASAIMALVYSVMLMSVGVKYAVLLAIMIGFSAFVPYLGFYISSAITLIMVYNQFLSVEKTILTAILLLGGQILDSGFITPKVVGDKLGVHPLFVIFGVLVSVPVFGALGILLALPLVGMMGVLIRFLVKKYKLSTYYKS